MSLIESFRRGEFSALPIVDYDVNNPYEREYFFRRHSWRFKEEQDRKNAPLQRGVYRDKSVPVDWLGYVLIGHDGEPIMKVAFPRLRMTRQRFQALWKFLEREAGVRTKMKAG